MAHFEGTMKYIYIYYLFYFINKNWLIDWLIEYVKYETTCMHCVTAMNDAANEAA